MIANFQSVRDSREATNLKPNSFAYLVFETEARMASCSSIPTFNPLFERRKSLNEKFNLVAKEWVLLKGSSSLATLRMVHIRGAKNEIINTWIFPNQPDRVPVFAAELIAVGGTVKVAFVDIQAPALKSPSLEQARILSASLAPRFRSLPCDEKAPDWAVGDSQGNFTYARNVPSDQFPEIEKCYLAYLDSYLSEYVLVCRVQNNAISREDSNALNVLHTYQHHHMEHSPGKKFLSVLFGSEWTDAFMKNFLFSMPRG